MQDLARSGDDRAAAAGAENDLLFGHVLHDVVRVAVAVLQRAYDGVRSDEAGVLLQRFAALVTLG